MTDICYGGMFDKLVAAVTAFPTMFALETAILENGYVPTLLPSRGGQTVRLARVLRALGHRVYTGV